MKFLVQLLIIALLIKCGLARVLLCSSYKEFKEIVMCKKSLPLGYNFLFLHAPLKSMEIGYILFDYPHPRFQWIEGYMCAICSADQELRRYNSDILKSEGRSTPTTSTFNRPYLKIDYETADVEDFDDEQIVFKTCIQIVKSFHFGFCTNQRLKQIVIENADEDVLEESEILDNPSSERCQLHYDNIIDFCIDPRIQNLSFKLIEIPEETFPDEKVPFTDCLFVNADSRFPNEGIEIQLQDSYEMQHVKNFKLFELNNQICCSLLLESTKETAETVNGIYTTMRKNHFKGIIRKECDCWVYYINSVLDSHYSRRTLVEAKGLDSIVMQLRRRQLKFIKNITNEKSDEIIVQMEDFYPRLFRFIVECQDSWSDVELFRKYSKETLKRIGRIYFELKDLFQFKYSLESRYIEGDINHPMFFYYILGCKLCSAFYQRIYCPIKNMEKALG